MLNKMKNFKFQGLLMELTLVAVNVLLVLSLIYFWSSYFEDKQANNDQEYYDTYVKVEGDSQGTK